MPSSARIKPATFIEECAAFVGIRSICGQDILETRLLLNEKWAGQTIPAVSVNNAEEDNRKKRLANSFNNRD
jgi:hypothetical protein